MIVKQVPELQVLPQHVEALVPPEALELRGMGAGLHAGAQRASLEAVPAELPPHEAGRGGAGLHDAADRPCGQRLGAEDGQGRGPIPARAGRQPQPPEHRPLRDAGGRQPSRQRAHRAQLGLAVG